jgi:ribonuclease III
LTTFAGHSFRSEVLLKQALRHRSVGSPNNERLEFLGDALLNCIVAELLYERLPHWSEGDLSRLRSSLVNQPSLVDIATRLGLGDHLELGDGELKSGGHRRPSILADALEAVLGAVYLDGGFDAARTVVLTWFAEVMSEPERLQPVKDPKTALQEWLQAQRIPLPSYRVIETAGDAHEQSFTITCTVETMQMHTQGNGSSRRAAEQQAASRMLEQLKTNSPRRGKRHVA